MPKTIRGVYHNLKESKYTISNSEVVFFFSSMTYLNKFMDNYQENRIEFNKKFNKLIDSPLNMDMLADVRFYEVVEKRGFRVWLKGVDMSCEDLHRYALRKMTEKNTLNWSEIVKPKLQERIKSME